MHAPNSKRSGAVPRLAQETPEAGWELSPLRTPLRTSYATARLIESTDSWKHRGQLLPRGFLSVIFNASDLYLHIEHQSQRAFLHANEWPNAEENRFLRSLSLLLNTSRVRSVRSYGSMRFIPFMHSCKPSTLLNQTTTKNASSCDRKLRTSRSSTDTQSSTSYLPLQLTHRPHTACFWKDASLWWFQLSVSTLWTRSVAELVPVQEIGKCAWSQRKKQKDVHLPSTSPPQLMWCYNKLLYGNVKLACPDTAPGKGHCSSHLSKQADSQHLFFCYHCSEQHTSSAFVQR